MNFKKEVHDKKYFQILLDAIQQFIREKQLEAIRKNQFSSIHQLLMQGFSKYNKLNECIQPMIIPSNSVCDYLFEESINEIYGTAKANFILSKSLFVECCLSDYASVEPKQYMQIFVLAIYSNDVEFVSNLLLIYSTVFSDLVNTSVFIDNLVECSIDNETSEITAILIDYKYKNNLFTENNFEL